MAGVPAWPITAPIWVLMKVTEVGWNLDGAALPELPADSAEVGRRRDRRPSAFGSRAARGRAVLPGWGLPSGDGPGRGRAGGRCRCRVQQGLGGLREHHGGGDQDDGAGRTGQCPDGLPAAGLLADPAEGARRRRQRLHVGGQPGVDLRVAQSPASPMAAFRWARAWCRSALIVPSACPASRRPRGHRSLRSNAAGTRCAA